MFENILLWSEEFLLLAGDSPFDAMWFLFTHGGWIFVLYVFLWGFAELWLEGRQNAFNAKKEWMLLAIDIPRTSEQTPRAVENIFAHLAGAHSPASWKEKWIDGRTQDTITVELASIEGHVQYLIRTTRGFRDLVEASIYAQYPDAEITEVEDYVTKVPQHYPDKEWDLFGTEMICVKPDVYPLRTYPEFEDKMTGEFKDPMAVLLENMSRLGPGEQAWYQIVLTPIEQVDFQKRGEALIKKLTGQEVKVKKTGLQQAVDLPFQAAGLILETAGIIPTPAPAKKETNQLNNRMLSLTPGERKVIEGIENKISKIAHQVKIRFLYVAKKDVMKKSRIVHPFIGAIKQFNTNDMQSLKPESKKVGVNGTLLIMKDRRNNVRKRRLIAAYRNRSNWSGKMGFCLNIEELASLWHFPLTPQTKVPMVKTTEVKRAPPPSNLPFG